MEIKMTITFQDPKDDHPRVVVQYFGSWPAAFKEGQKLINKFVRVRNAKLLKVVLEDEE